MMRNLIYIQIIFLVAVMVSGCNKVEPVPEDSISKRIGVWEVKGDSMMVWRGSSETPLHIKFTYVSSRDDNPSVRFTLIDSSITTEDYNDLNIFNNKYQLSVPASFDLISSSFRSRGFDSGPDAFSYEIVYEVYCENISTAEQLSFRSYNGGHSERKYELNTKGIGKAIRHIACK